MSLSHHDNTARTAIFQTAAGLAVVSQLEPGTGVRAAIGAACAFGVLALPFARFAAGLSRDHPSVYWWAGRVWTVAMPGIFAKTIPAALDGTGPAMAERVTTPFMLAALLGLSFGGGAQGALLGVTKDAASNALMLMGVMAAIKLQAAYTHAYLMLHVVALGGVALGYVCVSKYADVHEATHEAADAIVMGAAAREPFVVTDAAMNICAVNQRLLDVLGYEEHELLCKPVMMLLDEASSFGGDHAWIRRTLFEAASRKENPNGNVWSMLTKNGRAHPVRVTLGEARCPINDAKFFTAMFTSMNLEQRNAQLQCEKEKLQWEVASHHDGDWADPREALGASVLLGGNHRTLGAMQDQATTDDAVSCAHSFDHLTSSAGSPIRPNHALVASAPQCSEDSLTTSSIVSYKSSVMDTVSQAARKSPTRAPPPPKTRLLRPKAACSEPSSGAKAKARNSKNVPKRSIPTVEPPAPREAA